ncbi:MAG: VWA domain-containing protein [Planctomycetota bacterium]|nr:MAG: VWA domain-containing protein [Planctomycetota bacterium]REK18484.1 MAG: VWA domain-containing protein [Planctomycetota bacterium]REK39455.1 MAG: VWA domain-containing protein [Planctomycetota bacterium]
MSTMWKTCNLPPRQGPARQASSHRGSARQGATLVMICFFMTILIGLVAFGVEVGRMFLVRSQLQSAVDSGALAATMQLRQDSSDIDAAVAAANEFIQYNRVGWLVTIPEDAVTVNVGTWDSATQTFSSGGSNPNSVEVSGNANDEPLFFAGIFGHSSFAVPRSAIASGGAGKLDIIMTLDLSGSMGSNNRIQALRDAAPKFVDVIEEVGDDDRIGVMGYGALPDQYDPVAQGHNGTSYTSAPASQYPSDSDWCAVKEADLTSNFSHLRNNVLDSDTLVHNKYNGWTPIGAAIRDSAHYLDVNARNDVNKVIVLMSDGHANKPEDNGPGYAREMASWAASLDIKVYTISLGNGADKGLMQDIATITGAEYFDASGSSDELSAKLTDAFENVANTIKGTQLVQ